jgi:signal transduction histidine kinase
VERLYARLGARMIVWLLVPAVAAGLVTIAILGVWATRYMHVSARQLWLSIAVAAPWATVMTLLGVWTLRARFAAVLAWDTAERSPALVTSVWTAAVGLPAQVVARAFLALSLGYPIPAIGVRLAANVPVSAIAALGVAGYAGIFALLVPVMFGYELAVRPVLADVATYLPPEFQPQPRIWRLRTKALFALPSVTLFSAMTVGAFGHVAVSGPVRLEIAGGIGVAVTAVAGAIFWLVIRTSLDPLDELLAATRRVGNGDIDTPVPVVTDDELGTLAAGFNRMLAELRSHDADLLESRARIVAAADDARRRVERDLHDGAQQQLVLLGLKLGALRRQVDGDSETGRGLAELEGDLTSALRELRDLAHGLYPPLLESDGLPGALREAAQRSAIATELSCGHAGRYAPEIEAAVYFCCLEALQNASKHAGPGAKAVVTLSPEPDALRFEIADDGHGFDSNGKPAGAGLENMVDRIAALGGELRVSSRSGAGTTVSGTVPLRG